MCGQNFRLSKLGYFCILSLSCLVFFYFRGFSISQLTTIQNNDSVSLRRLLLASIQAAKLGGIKVKNIRTEQNLQVKSKGHTKEGANDLVTMGDMLSHKEMYFGLKKEFPRVHIVSEEVSSENDNQEKSLNLSELEGLSLPLDTYDTFVPNEDITVWIDPLDATQEYTENLTEFVTTMVCVAVKGEAIIGVIHLPFKDETVWAWKGNGHSSNIGDSIKTETNINSHMKVIVSRSHSGKVKEFAKKAFDKDTEIITAGGAGYKSLLVARKEVDAYIHTTAIKKWDICAGNAIIKQLGGDMTDLNGNEIIFLDKTRTELALNDGVIATFRNHLEIVTKLEDLNLNKTS